MLTDSYIEKESNDALREMIFDFFELNVTETATLHTDDVEVSHFSPIMVYTFYWKYINYNTKII